MQLQSKDANMMVDFYPVKYANGDVSERMMLKVVTFCNARQSKRYITKKDFQREVDSRIEGYGYVVTDMHTEPQLFNSGLACCCWSRISYIKLTAFSAMTMTINPSDLQALKENYVEHIIDGMDMDDLICMCRDLMYDAYKDYTWDEVTEEIKDLYDEETLIGLLPEWYTFSS